MNFGISITRGSDKTALKRRTAGTVASSGVPKFAKMTVTFGFVQTTCKCLSIHLMTLM